MTTLVFATNNQNKVDEVKNILGNAFEIISLKDAGIHIEIAEPHNSLEENATEKSKTIYSLTKKNCFSEDTGLEVAALNGEPGVKSARYAGEKSTSNDNIDKLLNRLEGQENRSARFKTVISLILNGEEHQFIGISKGSILKERIGENGFGYDTVFLPQGSDKSYGEMDIFEKNMFSHRKKAIEKLVTFLQNQS